jgi:tryptophan synthase alpha chain
VTGFCLSLKLLVISRQIALPTTRPSKNVVIGFGITEKTISNLRSADGLVVGSAICREITRSLRDRQNPVTNVSKLVRKLKNKII